MLVDLVDGGYYFVHIGAIAEKGRLAEPDSFAAEAFGNGKMELVIFGAEQRIPIQRVRIRRFERDALGLQRGDKEIARDFVESRGVIPECEQVEGLAI